MLRDTCRSLQCKNNILYVTDEDAFRGIARTLAWFCPDVWPQLQSQHVADSTGHCRACYSHATSAPMWPCRLRLLADEAGRLSGLGKGAPRRPR